MEKFIEVKISSVRVGLMSQNRVVLLRDAMDERYLPIWVDPNQAELITLALQDIQTARPLTHDLLKNLIRQLDARLVRVEIINVEKEVFYARLVIEGSTTGSEKVYVDCRPSDAIALAVRTNATIYVSDEVMQKASIRPDEDLIQLDDSISTNTQSNDDSDSNSGNQRLSLFDDFIDNMDF
jgi:bifunctional DNase/RNase